jgi:hypothetical protein
LIMLSLAVLVASGSIVTSYYSYQEMNETKSAFQQITGIISQVGSFDGECTIRLEMNCYLSSESILRIGNGSMMLFHDGQVLSANLPDYVQLKVLDFDGSERTTIEVAQNDVMVLERYWENGALRSSIHIENVDATFSTALTNRSISSTVL